MTMVGALLESEPVESIGGSHVSAKVGLLRWIGAFIAFDMALLTYVLIPDWRWGAAEPKMIIGGLTTVLAPPLLYMMTSILSPDLKAALVFWRTKYHLPGYSAFSRHLKEDSRIDADTVVARRGPLPSDPNAQQRLWYKIYRDHRNDEAVLDANRRYLTFRDLAVVSLLVTVAAPIALTIFNLGFARGPVAAIFCLQYLGASVVARGAGLRLVRTVLAIEGTQRGPVDPG